MDVVGGEREGERERTVIGRSQQLIFFSVTGGAVNYNLQGARTLSFYIENLLSEIAGLVIYALDRLGQSASI